MAESHLDDGRTDSSGMLLALVIVSALSTATGFAAGALLASGGCLA